MESGNCKFIDDCGKCSHKLHQRGWWARLWHGRPFCVFVSLSNPCDIECHEYEKRLYTTASGGGSGASWSITNFSPIEEYNGSDTDPDDTDPPQAA